MASRGPLKALVLTGDHGRADAYKVGGRYGEEDLLAHRRMVEALGSLAGLELTVCSDHGYLLDCLPARPPDLVVNFCDTGFRNVAALELNVPGYLELLGIPYTGAAPTAIAICADKQIVRLVAQSAGLAVPEERFVPAEANFEPYLPVAYPVIVKPNRTDGSLGITKDAVVRDRAEALAYLGWLRAALPGQSLLLQEYLPGAEYGVGLIGNPHVGAGLRALPALEVDFTGLPPGLAPILSYESKAEPDSPYWSEIKYRRAALDPEVEAEMAASALRLFERLELRDYGRFDFRTAADGTIKLMEVNPNPAWSWDGKLAIMAGFAGIAYPDMLRMILEAATARLGLDY